VLERGQLWTKSVSPCVTKLRMQQKQGGAMYSAVVNQLEFGSAMQT